MWACRSRLSSRCLCGTWWAGRWTQAWLHPCASMRKSSTFQCFQGVSNSLDGALLQAQTALCSKGCLQTCAAAPAALLPPGALTVAVIRPPATGACRRKPNCVLELSFSLRCCKSHNSVGANVSMPQSCRRRHRKPPRSLPHISCAGAVHAAGWTLLGNLQVSVITLRTQAKQRASDHCLAVRFGRPNSRQERRQMAAAPSTAHRGRPPTRPTAWHLNAIEAADGTPQHKSRTVETSKLHTLCVPSRLRCSSPCLPARVPSAYDRGTS